MQSTGLRAQPSTLGTLPRSSLPSLGTSLLERKLKEGDREEGWGWQVTTACRELVQGSVWEERAAQHRGGALLAIPHRGDMEQSCTARGQSLPPLKGSKAGSM